MNEALMYVILAVTIGFVLCQVWIFYKLKTLRTGGHFRNYPFYLSKRVQARRCFNHLPKHFIVLLLLHEDLAFFHHHGFNFREIWHSAQQALTSRQLKGGSSLSQQTVKLLLFFRLPPLIRKVFEVTAVLMLEFLYSKEEILSIYLQVARFGPHIFGLDDACQALLSKSPTDLTLSESEILVSMLPNPSRFLASLGVEPLKIYVSKQVDFSYDFSLSYEKILHTQRILKLTAQKSAEDLAKDFFSIAMCTSCPAQDIHEENHFIIDTTRLVHKIPVIIEQISQSNPRMPKFLDAALSLDERLLVYNYLGSNQINPILLKQQSNTFNLDGVRALARYHRIAQLTSAAGVAELEDKKTLLLETTALFMRRKSSLEYLIKKFAEYQIPFYLVRGIDLAIRYYPDPAQKLFADFDLVIDQGDFMRVSKLLSDLKFTIKTPGKNLSLQNKNLLLNLARLREGVDCTHESDDTRLDIHPIGSKEFAEAFARSERVQLSETVSYQALAWNENVKHVLFHGQKHLWHRLCWIYDATQVLSKGSEDQIRSLHLQSKNEGWERTFLVGVSLSYLFCSLKIEQALVDLIIDDFMKRSPVYSYIQAQIFYPALNWRQRMFNILHRRQYEEGMISKERITFNRIFSPTKNDLFSLNLPAPLYFVYYFYRPFRILKELIFAKALRS